MDIHRCRFVPYAPSAINALAFSHPSNPTAPSKGPPDLRLAIGRANGDIEIWNPLKGAWCQESILRGGKDRSIEGLVWIQDPEETDRHGYKIPGKLRLFSIGYSTAVTEWDLASGRPLRHSAGNYKEIWCMAAQPKGRAPKKTANEDQEQTAEEEESQTQNVAVGCADGAIVLLNTADNDLRFTRILARPAKKKSRVLSITFQNRHTIIAGHADSTIRIYDIRNAQQVRIMTLGAGPRNGPKETLVWSVKCLNDGTIVSGDSTGTVSFWDGKNYTLLQRIQSHEADILEIAVSADGQSVFSGGMDRRTTLYRETAGGGSARRHRWAEVTHRRMNKHDVKAMATFETRLISILVSGGLDPSPIVVPIKEFGRENHRALSYLPQRPVIRCAPRRRLMMSWWDQEVNIWTILRHVEKGTEREMSPKSVGPQGRKLVAKVVLKGDESITSADLSTDGSILAVSTMAELKLFRLRPKVDSFRVLKVDLSSEMAKTGAKSIHFSPDERWLAVIRFDDAVQLYRIRQSESPKQYPQILPKAVNLTRLARGITKRKNQLESLGNYNRHISHIAFSADSRILAVADISGHLDTWVLEGQEDLMQEDDETPNGAQSSSSSADNSDIESDEEEHTTVMFGQHWIRNPAASLLIKLPAAPLILSFRPSTTHLTNALKNGSRGVHPTRHTPHPHSHDLPAGEDRLFILTVENQMYEFNVLSGKMSDWSRRNPTSSLPREFRDLRDRAMGAVWDVQKQNERIWLYGVNSLWMFDLSRDLPALGEQDTKPPILNGEGGTNQLKRKREDNKDDAFAQRPRHDTGAGSKVRNSEQNLGIGRKVRKIEGVEAKGAQLLRLDREQSPTSDEEDGFVLANESTLAHLRRNGGEEDGESDDEQLDKGEASANDDNRVVRRAGKDRPPYWHTFKYRPILGIVPLEGETDDEEEDDADEGSPRGIEVALVERPLWDVDLPPQYYGNQEWNP